MTAAVNGHEEVCSLLAELGADPYMADQVIENVYGQLYKVSHFSLGCES